MDHRQGPLRVHLRHDRRPHHDAARPQPRDRAARAGLVARGSGGCGQGPRRSRGQGRRAARRSPDRRGRVRLQQVRPHRPAYQRHRLPRPRALRGGGAVPGLARRRDVASTSRSPISRRRRPSCWSASSPRTRTAASSCACARPSRAGVKVVAIASHATRGLRKMSGELVQTIPGDEPAALAALELDRTRSSSPASDSPSVAGRLQRSSSPRPTRPAPASRGSRAAPASVERSRPAACPTCCPVAARSTTSRRAPTSPPRGACARSRHAGAATPPRSSSRRPPRHGPRPAGRRRRDRRPARSRPPPAGRSPRPTSSSASRSARARSPSVADVVLPVAPVVEKPGTFVNWEGRVRTFDAVLHEPNSLTDIRVLAGIAEEMGQPLGFRTVAQARAAPCSELGPWDGARAAVPPWRRADAGAPQAHRRARHLAPHDRRRPRPGRPAAAQGDRPPGRAAGQRGDAQGVRRRAGRHGDAVDRRRQRQLPDRGRRAARRRRLGPGQLRRQPASRPRRRLSPTT